LGHYHVREIGWGWLKKRKTPKKKPAIWTEEKKRFATSFLRIIGKEILQFSIIPFFPKAGLLRKKGSNFFLYF